MSRTMLPRAPYLDWDALGLATPPNRIADLTTYLSALPPKHETFPIALGLLGRAQIPHAPLPHIIKCVIHSLEMGLPRSSARINPVIRFSASSLACWLPNDLLKLATKYFTNQFFLHLLNSVLTRSAANSL